MKRFALIFLLMLFAASANAGVWLDVKYGPWVSNVSETGFDVLWVTPDASLASVAVFPDDGSVFYVEKRQMFYESVAGRRPARKIHCVKVRGLEPGKTYRYRIFGKTELSPDPSYALEYGGERDYGKENKVRTLDRNAKTCNFSIVNDIHAAAARYRDLVCPLDREKTDFLVLNGDMVHSAHKIDTVLKYTYDVVKDCIGSLPVVFVRGNHENRGKDFYMVPELNPTPNGRMYYMFRQGPAAILVLDSGEDKPDDSVEYSGTAVFDNYRAEQLAWLKEAVKDPDWVNAPYRVVFVHIPPRSDSEAWYADRRLHDEFLPVLNEAGTDYMFCGHFHERRIVEPNTWDNHFPIIINSNTDRVDVSVSEKSFKYNIISSSK